MAEKELRRMNRTELIEIIYALQQGIFAHFDRDRGSCYYEMDRKQKGMTNFHG